MTTSISTIIWTGDNERQRWCDIADVRIFDAEYFVVVGTETRPLGRIFDRVGGGFRIRGAFDKSLGEADTLIDAISILKENAHA